MKLRKLGSSGQSVSAIGLGCMGMSFGYGGGDDTESLSTIHRAVDLGVTFFDTAALYGPFAFKILPTGRGMERMAGVDSRPVHIREAVDGSLSRLGVETIDLLYQHRVDPTVPVEDVVGVMADLVREGKVQYLGLSEVSAGTLRRAHAVHPIAAVQSEYSLWSRDVEAEVLPACRELGVGFVPYSPLGRGFLTGKLNSTEGLAADDYRRTLPRFQTGALDTNKLLVAELERLAGERGVTAAQLALAWLLAQSETIIPIPGARRLVHLEENVTAGDIVLNKAELAAIAAAVPESAVTGARYTERELGMVGL
jgi:aryl-alcohol dehydrogenase-like predicted oxidoreductase